MDRKIGLEESLLRLALEETLPLRSLACRCYLKNNCYIIHQSRGLPLEHIMETRPPAAKYQSTAQLDILEPDSICSQELSELWKQVSKYEGSLSFRPWPLLGCIGLPMAAP